MKTYTAWHLGIAFLLSVAVSSPAQRIPIDGFAAQVNDRVITMGDVLELIQPAEQQLRRLYQGRELEQKMADVYADGLKQLIEQALILEEFELTEAEIPPTLVDDQVQSIIEERFGNDRSRFLSALKEQQVSVEEWRETVAERLAVMFLRREEVLSQVVVSPTAVIEYYNDHRDEFSQPAEVLLRMIVLQRGVTDEEKQVKLDEAKRLVRELDAGEDFAALARASSEGGRAARGGEWDWIEPDKLRKELNNAVRFLQPGEYSDVVETENELYIVKLEGRKAAKLAPLEEVKPGIEANLQSEERERLTREWMNQLRNRHFVKIHKRPDE